MNSIFATEQFQNLSEACPQLPSLNSKIRIVLLIKSKPPGGGVRPYKKLMGMGSYFHDWIGYNGVVHFRILGGKTVS